jgi:hypothetical protein
MLSTENILSRHRQTNDKTGCPSPGRGSSGAAMNGREDGELDPPVRTTGAGSLIGSSAVPFAFRQATRTACCCGGCGYVGNASALSKRSGISTAVSSAAVASLSLHTAIGVRFAGAWLGLPRL